MLYPLSYEGGTSARIADLVHAPYLGFRVGSVVGWWIGSGCG